MAMHLNQSYLLRVKFIDTCPLPILVSNGPVKIKIITFIICDSKILIFEKGKNSPASDFLGDFSILLSSGFGMLLNNKCSN